MRPPPVAARRLLLLAALGLAGCGGADPVLPPIPPATGWTVSTPGEHGLDAGKLAELSQALERGDHGSMHSLVVVRDGALVYESYFRGYGRGDLHRQYSVTKSVASALIGSALDRGLIRGTDATLGELLPDYFAGSSRGSPASRITLEQVLTMTAGFSWNENEYAYTDPRNAVTILTRSPDWLRFALDRPVGVPGTQFVYDSGCSLLLSGILERATGKTAAAYATESLFAPLGLEGDQWVDEGPGGLTNTGWGLRLRPLDMARLGLLYLRGGDWHGRRLISESWVRRSVSSLAARPPAPYEYGYQWWRWPSSAQSGDPRATDVVFAWGWGGQHILLLPRYDMVVVFTAGNFEGDGDPRALVRAVLGAVRD